MTGGWHDANTCHLCDETVPPPPEPTPAPGMSVWQAVWTLLADIAVPMVAWRAWQRLKGRL